LLNATEIRKKNPVLSTRLRLVTPACEPEQGTDAGTFKKNPAGEYPQSKYEIQFVMLMGGNSAESVVDGMTTGSAPG
jgi:hypothetical protein